MRRSRRACAARSCASGARAPGTCWRTGCDPGLAAAAVILFAVLVGMQVSSLRDLDQPDTLADRLLAAETTTGSDIVLSGLVGD